MDWRVEQAIDSAQWMRNECRRCPLCGSMVCGDKQKADHKDWHATVNQAIQSLRDRVTALEALP